MGAISFYPVNGIGEIANGSDLSEALMAAIRAGETPLLPGDILVITHKIVSKATGNVRQIEDITPSEAAIRIGEEAGKDPRIVEAILALSDEVISCRRGIIMAERKDGWICANAGVDESNSGGQGKLILLPPDCDAQAEALSNALSSAFGFPIPVIICDTHGRALRNGAIGICVGSYGLTPIRRYKGQADRNGRILMHTEEAVADELASAATLVMGQGAEGIPAVIVRGFAFRFAEEDCSDLKRPKAMRVFGIKEEAVVSRTAN